MNLFQDFSENGGSEIFETLLSGKHIRIERIISCGQSSPDGFWYNQDENEWIAILEGSAVLRFDDKDVTMRKGDTMLIAAHQRHRVLHTDNPTIWLAVFFG